MYSHSFGADISIIWQLQINLYLLHQKKGIHMSLFFMKASQVCREHGNILAGLMGEWHLVIVLCKCLFSPAQADLNFYI